MEDRLDLLFPMMKMVLIGGIVSGLIALVMVAIL